jgi:hypothetical protein
MLGSRLAKDKKEEKEAKDGKKNRKNKTARQRAKVDRRGIVGGSKIDGRKDSWAAAVVDGKAKCKSRRMKGQ